MPPTPAHDRFEQVGVVLKTGYTSTAHAIELITRNCLGFKDDGEQQFVYQRMAVNKTFWIGLVKDKNSLTQFQFRS